ncbi:MAG: hypothetical protein WCW27_01975 [Patescibacteria group bacterium]|jgi:hypothetical protein
MIMNNLKKIMLYSSTVLAIVLFSAQSASAAELTGRYADKQSGTPGTYNVISAAAVYDPSVKFIGNDTTVAGAEYIEFSTSIAKISSSVDMSKSALTFYTGTNHGQLANGTAIPSDGGVVIKLADYLMPETSLNTSVSKPIACYFDATQRTGQCLIRLLVSSQTYSVRSTSTEFKARTVFNPVAYSDQYVTAKSSQEVAYKPYVDKSNPAQASLKIGGESAATTSGIYYLAYDASRSQLDFVLNLYDDIAVKKVQLEFTGYAGNTLSLNDEKSFTVSAYPNIYSQEYNNVTFSYGPNTEKQLVLKDMYSITVTTTDWLDKSTENDYVLVIDDTVPTISSGSVIRADNNNTINTAEKIASGTGVKFKCIVKDNEAKAAGCTMKLYKLLDDNGSSSKWLATWNKVNESDTETYKNEDTFTSDSITLSEGGDYYVEMVGNNLADMNSAVKRLDFSVAGDGTAPVINSTYLAVDVISGNNIGKPITFEVSATDAESKIAKVEIQTIYYKYNNSTGSPDSVTTINSEDNLSEFSIYKLTPEADGTGETVSAQAKAVASAKEGKYTIEARVFNIVSDTKYGIGSQTINIGKTVINSASADPSTVIVGNTFNINYSVYNSFEKFDYTLTNKTTGKVVKSGYVYTSNQSQASYVISGITAEGCSNSATTCTQTYTLKLHSYAGDTAKDFTVAVEDNNHNCASIINESASDFGDDNAHATEVYYNCTQGIDGYLAAYDADMFKMKLVNNNGVKQVVTAKVSKYDAGTNSYSQQSQLTMSSDNAVDGYVYFGQLANDATTMTYKIELTYSTKTN